jgi:hypothetical protein
MRFPRYRDDRPIATYAIDFHRIRLWVSGFSATPMTLTPMTLTPMTLDSYDSMTKAKISLDW